MTSLINYPQEHLISFVICLFIVSTFAYYIMLRRKSKQNINIANALLNIIEQNSFVDQLSSLVRQGRKDTSKSRIILISHLNDKLKNIINSQDKSNILTNTIKDKVMPVGYLAISDHLINIFMSGLFESRLETEALIKHTELKLFNEAIRLKNILSSFIVLGLLGTLFGMSESLGKFDQSSVNVTNLVSRDLPSAFIPSILGIICTIFGMILYSRLVHTYFTPIKTKLENLTLNLWIPMLCPAFTESLVEKLEENARRIEDQFANAAVVAEFARDIQTETSQFKNNLKNADETLSRIAPLIIDTEASTKSLKQFADKLSKFSEKFTLGLDTFKNYEERLATKYEGLTNANETFASLLSTWSSKFEDIVGSYNVQTADINNKIERIFAAILNFEEEYLDANNIQSEAVTNLVNTVKMEKESDAVQNREIAEKILEESTIKFDLIIDNLKCLTSSITSNLEAIDKDLSAVDDSLKSNLGDVSIGIIKGLVEIQSDLNTGLKGVQDDITSGLNLFPAKLEENHAKLITQFGRYDAPVRVAAERLQLSYEGMVTAIQSLIRQFKEEISLSQSELLSQLNIKVNELSFELRSNNDRVIEQTVTSKNMVTSIETLNSTIHNLQTSKRSWFS